MRLPSVEKSTVSLTNSSRGWINGFRHIINDKRLDAEGHRMRFTSKILPPYLRRTRSIEDLVPWLYLKGISTGDFPEALQALLGPGAEGLSATNICRLKRVWEDEWKQWSVSPMGIGSPNSRGVSYCWICNPADCVLIRMWRSLTALWDFGQQVRVSIACAMASRWARIRE